MEDGKVTFSWKDRSDDNKTKFMTLDGEEFMRRFLLHVLPKSFRKIRYFGFLSPRYKTENIRIIRELIGKDGDVFILPYKETIEEMMLRLTGKNINRCPACEKGRMFQVYKLKPGYYEYIVPRRKKEVCNTS